MRKARVMVAVIVFSVAVRGLISIGRAQTAPKIEPTVTACDIITSFLNDFSAAVAALDVQKAEALFLPPDDSADGKNRSSHIKELKKDWAGAKHWGHAGGRSVEHEADGPSASGRAGPRCCQVLRNVRPS